jgi:bifunctional non-homologous end joining protein LigD
MARQGSDPLGRYRAMRDASRTTEPFGAARGTEAAPFGLFVVQKHAASRLHYDFRLELGGVLLSWAVPKGPSADPAEKRLAVRTEDHPLEYADFEGVIPEGSYGAGPVVVWDRGTFEWMEDPASGLEKGKLLFALHGHKLRGTWTLVRTRRAPREWLLIKHRDAFDSTGPAPGEASVLSGRTVEDLEAGRDPGTGIEVDLARAGAPRRQVRVAEARPMLAESRDLPFSGEGWLFEVKYDGYRALAGKDGRAVEIRYRGGRDATALYPELAAALRALPAARAVLDGEIAVLDEEGRPSFQALQRRAQLSRPRDVERAARERPATFLAFDLLALGDRDARPLPLRARKEALRRLLPPSGALRYADHVEAQGEALFAAARARGLEGIVAKRADAPYRAGRSAAWVKVRSERSDDFAVVGYTEPRRGRAGFGALHLAVGRGDGFAYAGSVGTGFSQDDLASIAARLERLRPAPSPPPGAPRARGDRWVEPELVAEVRYLEWTADGRLRHPVFVRMRDDKRPGECQAPPPRDPPPAAPPPEAHEAAVERGGGAGPPDAREPGPARAGERDGSRARTAAVPPASVHASGDPPLTNLDKVYWPADGYTKGDLIAYYRAVGPWILPYLEGRPLTLTRFPDGIEGKSFFQKDAPAWTPSWVRTETVWSEDAKREISYFVADDVESLLYVVNLGSIPLHVWASRLPDLARPDWAVLDIDPKDAPFGHVVRIARQLGRLCREVGLPSYPKTTGQRGLHVLVPLGRQLTHAQARDLAHALCRRVADEMPDVATLARTVAARGGRVYLDWLQNGQGKTLVAPFSVRPRPGAPVSTPLRWSEVNAGLDPARFTIETVPRRLRRRGEDPLRPVLEERPDLLAALRRLARLLGGPVELGRGPSAPAPPASPRRRP